MPDPTLPTTPPTTTLVPASRGVDVHQPTPTVTAPTPAPGRDPRRHPATRVTVALVLASGIAAAAPYGPASAVFDRTVQPALGRTWAAVYGAVAPTR